MLCAVQTVTVLLGICRNILCLTIAHPRILRANGVATRYAARWHLDCAVNGENGKNVPVLILRYVIPVVLVQ
jgi:hypothetical protein